MLDRYLTKRGAMVRLLKTKDLARVFAPFRVRFQGEVFGSGQRLHWRYCIPLLPGVLAYGATADESLAKAKALAFRVLADRLEHGEDIPEIQGVFAVHE